MSRGSGSLAADVSREMVRLMSRFTGRGPTKARTTLDTNVLVVLLEDTLTKAEKNLVAAGEEEAVLHMRRTFQETMHDDAVAKIEELTGRRVVSFLCDTDVQNDVAAEVFVFDGQPATGGVQTAEMTLEDREADSGK